MIELVDNHHGVYIPQIFAKTIDRSKVKHVTEEDWEILKSGPDHEEYWDTWDTVLRNAEIVADGVTYRLHHDMDLWALTEAELEKWEDQ